MFGDDLQIENYAAEDFRAEEVVWLKTTDDDTKWTLGLHSININAKRLRIKADKVIFDSATRFGIMPKSDWEPIADFLQHHYNIDFKPAGDILDSRNLYMAEGIDQETYDKLPIINLKFWKDDEKIHEFDMPPSVYLQPYKD